MKYILALDQGTTSSRAILFDEKGSIAAQAQHEFPQIYPRGGWVEHDPFDILTSQLTSAIEALGKAGARPRDVAAAGITNQRETTIVWDRETGKPVYNAIVWQDRRTAEACNQLISKGAEEMVRQKTGLLIDPYFSGSKIAWILDHVEGARQRAKAGKLAFGTVDSWLIWNLTSGARHVTDVTNASRTMLFDITRRQWDSDLLELLGVPESMMPEVIWSSEKIGPVTTTLGLGAVELAGVAGDQQAALFGQLCLRPGDVKNTYGTGCFLVRNIGEKFALSSQKLITTIVASAERKLEYGLEGSIFVGGAVVQWLRDNLGFVEKSSDIEKLAGSVEDSDGVVLVPAFVGLGAPYWDPYAGAMMIGLRRSTTRAHIARAALESIAFQVADVLDAMNTDLGRSSSPLRVDGGASANDLLMQFQADLLGADVIRPKIIESTALGAAYLAGLAVGFWESPAAIRATDIGGRRFGPHMDAARVKQMRSRWAAAVERSRNWSRDNG